MIALLLPVLLGNIVAALPSHRVVNGVPSMDGAWPSQLSMLEHNAGAWEHVCGAILINEHWALSAAHCTDAINPEEILIQAGVNNRDDLGGQFRAVINIIQHPDYDPMTYANDICVMQFNASLELNAKVQPAVFPDRMENFIDSPCVITGWGRIGSSPDFPNDLRQGDVAQLTNEECASRVGLVGPYNICVIDHSAEYGACTGDFGGPLHCLTNTTSSGEVWKQAGVGSWVVSSGGNCLTYFPSVYSRTSYFKDWIEANTS